MLRAAVFVVLFAWHCDAAELAVRVGLWAAPAPVAPWEFRKRK